MLIVKPLDFRAIIRHILASGLTREAICMHCSLARTSLFNYENGTTPLHPVGERLLDLWSNRTGNHRGTAPVSEELNRVKPVFTTTAKMQTTATPSHSQTIFQKWKGTPA